jgi:hypothetical protein
VDTEWQAFFSALVGVSVIAYAVLLATVLRTGNWWRGSALKEVAAVLPLLALLVPLVAGLVALMPGSPWRVGYLVMGGVGICGLVWHAATYLRHEEEADSFDDRQIQWGLPVSLGLYLSVVAFSCSGASWAVFVVAGLSVALLVTGSAGVWFLLSRRPDVRRGGPARNS